MHSSEQLRPGRTRVLSERPDLSEHGKRRKRRLTQSTHIMKQELEPHTLTSLARRLRARVSRNTLRKWITDGTIRAHSTAGKMLIFSSRKLDQLSEVLEKAHGERLKRLCKSDQEARRDRATAESNALRILKLNDQRIREGKKPLREPDPAMNDDDARGIVRMREEQRNVQRIFSGYGLNR